MITPSDDRLYGLKPLPEVPFCGPEEAQALRDAWEVQLAAQRAADGLPALGVGVDRHGRPTR